MHELPEFPAEGMCYPPEMSSGIEEVIEESGVYDNTTQLGPMIEQDWAVKRVRFPRS